jgi:hypothetical protein
MSQKIQSQFGFVEVVATGSPGDFTRVGGVSGIRDIRSGTAAEIDVSDLQSTAKEFVLGLADNGSMSFDLFYDQADPGQITLEQLRESSASASFRVGVRNPLQAGSPTGFTLLSFTGFVATFPITLGVDAAVTGTCTVRITGAITKV